MELIYPEVFLIKQSACTFTDISECLPDEDHCENEGVCLKSLGSFHCECGAGTEGQHCEEGRRHHTLILLLSKGKPTLNFRHCFLTISLELSNLEK